MSETKKDVERARQLMMGRVDGELSPEEDRELDALIETNDEFRSEMKRMERVKTVTAAVSLKMPPDQIWEDYMNSVYQKVERGVGWILLSVGAIVTLSYGLWNGVSDLLENTTLPWFVKGAVLALLVGGVIITVSVVREKLFMRSKDPYREIER